MKTNIMLIDDNKIDLFVSQKIIEKAGIDANVKTFESGFSALGFLKSINDEVNCQLTFRPHVIFLDINMPGMNGFEFLNELDKLHNIKENNIKIYMLSSSTNLKDIENSKNIKSCTGFINKPLTVAHLNNIKISFTPYLNRFFKKSNRIEHRV